MAKHTPTPWTAQRSSAMHDGEYDYAISAEGAPVLAEVFGRTSDGGHPPAAANAAFLVRAVNSHEALIEALRWVRSNYAGGSTKEINARIDAAISQAEASK